jgi:hypothetical protein
LLKQHSKAATDQKPSPLHIPLLSKLLFSPMNKKALLNTQFNQNRKNVINLSDTISKVKLNSSRSLLGIVLEEALQGKRSPNTAQVVNEPQPEKTRKLEDLSKNFCQCQTRTSKRISIFIPRLIRGKIHL